MHSIINLVIFDGMVFFHDQSISSIIRLHTGEIRQDDNGTENGQDYLSNKSQKCVNIG